MGTLGARPGWRRGVLVARALPPPSAKMASGYIRYLFQKQPLSVLVGSTALLSTGGYLLKLSQARVNMRAHKIATEAGIERAEERAREAEEHVRAHHTAVRSADEWSSLGPACWTRGWRTRLRSAAAVPRSWPSWSASSRQPSRRLMRPTRQRSSRRTDTRKL